MFGKKTNRRNEEKKVYTMLVNCAYGFLKFEDESHNYAIYENQYTGKLIRFCVADATYEPIA